jgi:hypothetical protein
MDSPMTYEEIHKRTSDQITKEEGLIHNRLTWMLTFQGFLFAAVVLSANTAVEERLGHLLRTTIPWLALCSAVLALTGVSAAYLSINNIKEILKKYEPTGADAVKLPAHGTALASLLGRITSLGLPLLVIVAWGYLMCNGISGEGACCHH